MPEYTFHPLAQVWPLMDDAELSAMAKSIAERGQLLSIWKTPDGQIIDGRNRLRACELAGVPPQFEEYDESRDGDLEGFIEALNEHRRHLSKSDRRKVMQMMRDAGESLRTIAAAVGVDAGTVSRNTVPPVANATPDATNEPDDSNGEQLDEPDELFQPEPEPPKVSGRDGKSYPNKRYANKPAKRGRKKTGDSPKDHNRRAIPESLREVFGYDDRFKRILDEQLSPLSVSIQDLGRAQYLDAKAVRICLNCIATITSHVKSNRPWIVCQECGGDGCRRCNRKGYLSQPTA